MKLNRSLAISSKIQELKMSNVIGMLTQAFPRSIFNASPSGDKTSRERVFTVDNTMLTMVLTAVQEDKSLKNSVDLYYTIHQQHKKQILAELEKQVAQEKQKAGQAGKRKVGRPKKLTVEIPKSLSKDISLNTAAYSKARKRIPQALTERLFSASRIQDAKNDYTHWHGYHVYIGDGTYLQMQDTESLREKYEVKHKGKSSEGYPQGLLEAITERGTGQLHSFRLANRHVSELALFYEMIDELPPGSLLLLDDLYNCYEIIAKCKRKGIEIVVPAKRARDYKLIEVLGNGDEIIEIGTPKNRSKWLEKNEKPQKLLLRQIHCESPDGKQYKLITSILDKTINKNDIQLLYLTRWDIEVSIREIKTIMDINILRSKTPEMALKELTVSLATYNLIRKIIYASIKDLPFSPKEDFIHQFYTHNKGVLVDKKGRVYSRWSTGRRRTKSVDNQGNITKKKTKQEIR
jgi:hypothetical protein